MYYANQTLRHKETNKLARLCPKKEDSAFAWDISEKTRFIDEHGKIFYDDIKNYTHIEDEFGRPCSNPPGKGQYVDESAKKYTELSDLQRAKLRKKSALVWESRILKKMQTCDEVVSPFANGSKCPYMYSFFMERRKAKPAWRYAREDSYRIAPPIFKHKGEHWVLQNDILHKVKLNK